MSILSINKDSIKNNKIYSIKAKIYSSSQLEILGTNRGLATQGWYEKIECSDMFCLIDCYNYAPKLRSYEYKETWLRLLSENRLFHIDTGINANWPCRIGPRLCDLLWWLPSIAHCETCVCSMVINLCSTVIIKFNKYISAVYDFFTVFGSIICIIWFEDVMPCSTREGKEKDPSEDSTNGNLSLSLRTAIYHIIGRHTMRSLLQSGWMTNSSDPTYLLPANKVWGKVIFLHLSVILFTPLDQVHPLGQVHPPDQVPPRTRYTPWDQVHSPGPGTPPWDQVHPLGPGTPPWDQVHPPSSACWEIWTTSGRYASYWNVFLLFHKSF